MKCRVGVVKGEELLSYSFPSQHPFTADRARAFWSKLERESLPVELLRPEKAEPEVIELFHTKDHISFVKKASEYGYGYLDQGDTPAFNGIFDAAQYTVGSTLTCLEKVLNGELDHAFNPVGGLHHATRNSSAGFCVFNDIGVAIETLRKKGIRRILYADIDVHHGDGVFYAYEPDPELIMFDIHEDGRFLYPGTGHKEERGRGLALGTKLNIPLLPASGDKQVEDILPSLESLTRRFPPEFIIFQCGADGLEGDPIAGLRYTDKTHRMVAQRLHGLSHEFCSGRLIALGGGGYKPENCANAWFAVVKSLISSE
jgi:acetoin utilization protein AcuC